MGTLFLVSCVYVLVCVHITIVLTIKVTLLQRPILKGNLFTTNHEIN